MNLDLQNYSKKKNNNKKEKNSQNVNKNILSWLHFLNWSGEGKQTMF